MHLRAWRESQFLKFLDLLSKKTLESSNDEEFTLQLIKVDITASVLPLLVQLLNQPLPRKLVQNDNDSKWDLVQLIECRIELPPATLETGDNNRYCTPDDIHILLSTLMSRTLNLTLQSIPELVSWLTRVPQLDPVEIDSLFVYEKTLLTANEYEQLGTMIQRSAYMSYLCLSIAFNEVPREMYDRLSDAIHLKKLALNPLKCTNRHEIERIQSDLVGFVQRLLQNPHSQLEHLQLGDIALEDQHFMAIVQMLPKSQLKFLKICGDKISTRGILEFAKHLPGMKSLKSIEIIRYDGLVPCLQSAKNMVCEALIQGMLENYSVEVLDLLPWNIRANSPQERRLRHLTDINRAGRHLLVGSTVIPLGLWPYILERAGSRFVFQDPSHECLTKQEPARKANAVFFLLQNGPIFCYTRGSQPPLI